MAIVKCDSQYCDDVDCLTIRKDEAKEALRKAQDDYAAAVRAVYTAKADEEIRSTIG